MLRFSARYRTLTTEYLYRVNLSHWLVAKPTRNVVCFPEIRSFLYNRGHASCGQTDRCRVLRRSNGSRHSRCGFRVLQKPILGTADSEHWRCLGVRSFLFKIPQAPMNKARRRLFLLRSCGRDSHSQSNECRSRAKCNGRYGLSKHGADHCEYKGKRKSDEGKPDQNGLLGGVLGAGKGLVFGMHRASRGGNQ